MEKSSADGGKSNAKSKMFDLQNIVGENSSETKFQNEILTKATDEENAIRRLSYREVGEKPSILSMRNEWTTYSSVEVQRKILQENTEKIKNFMNSLSVPSWYRGVSVFQKSAADRLRNAIRDDHAQRTVYRTMKCLESIGLDPLPTTKQLHKILPLCGGNDLALLWFLMKWLYTDKDSNSYSMNEQLIMSSIAHLDMITTMHELDRILPPRQVPKIEESLRKSKTLQNISKIQQKQNQRVLPYFEKLPQRRPIKLRSIKASKNLKKSYKVHPYDSVDSSYAVLNGDSRWFHNNNFENNDRPVHNMKENEIGDLLESFEAAMAEEIKANETCGQHQNIEYIKKSFDSELNAITKQISEELEQIFEGKQKIYKQLIVRLYYDIEKCRQEFYSTAANYHRLLAGKRHGNKDKESNLLLNDCVIQIGPTTIEEKGKLCKVTKNKSLLQNSSTSKLSETASEPDYVVFSQSHQPLTFNYCNIFSCDINHSKYMKNPSNESYSGENQNVCKHGAIGIEDSAKINVVDYGLGYYDPEDDELMDRMLTDGLNIMKKNQKFVFASIPAAHRFPKLREWIRSRYGKKSNRIELSRCFSESKSIFVALAKVGLPVELPSNADMGSNLITNYSCRDYVLQKSHYIRNQFYNRINKAMLAQTRVIYFAMRHCSRVQSYNTLFAYMPAHKREIYHFRPWKLGESMKRTQPGSYETNQNGITTTKRPPSKNELK